MLICRGTIDNAGALVFSNAAILGRGSTKTQREISEAFYIMKGGNNCVSDMSLLLSSREMNFLNAVVDS